MCECFFFLSYPWGQCSQLTQQRGVTAVCWLVIHFIFISSALCLVAKEAASVILSSLVFMGGRVRDPGSDWPSWISQMPLENLQKNCYSGFVKYFSLKSTRRSACACNTRKLFKRLHRWYIYFLSRWKSIVRFPLWDQPFLPRTLSLFMHFHFHLNKIDLTPFSSCYLKKWFPRWGIMSYKNIRLTLNMYSGGILFWNSC